MNSLPPAIFLMGPTAAGKTDVAVALCERLPCEIINVDSALIYRGMDIGTAKPDAALLARAPHRLIDIRDPAQAYSAAEFRVDALRHMHEIRGAGRIPLLVGGTMLYFKVLMEGLAALPEADPALRAQIAEEAARLGWPHIHTLLASVDPETAARLNPNDPQRLQRALEVYRLTGVPLSEWHRRQRDAGRQPAPPPGVPDIDAYTLWQFAVAPRDRAVLHQRIALRFQAMLEGGFLDEVAALYQRGDLHPGLPAIRAVGYRQAWEYLAGTIGREDMVARGIAATRQLAKRQFTWLRGWPALRWLHPEDAPSSVAPADWLADVIRGALAEVADGH